ncbi:MAG: hypothetical protein JXC32_13015 [Anaerolineae bacterium]|nr:hypothetical protein [Anaerolineae bacterium]
MCAGTNVRTRPTARRRPTGPSLQKEMASICPLARTHLAETARWAVCPLATAPIRPLARTHLVETARWAVWPLAMARAACRQNGQRGCVAGYLG